MSLFGSEKDDKKYVIAYFDVLGTKAQSNSNIDSVISGLELINHFLNKDTYCNKKIVVRSFSDNFLVAIEDSNSVSDLESLLAIVCKVMYLCFKDNGTLIRGSITKGNMIINNQIILGEALIRAYKIEEEVAVYPRIVIDKCLIRSLYDSLSNRALREWLYVDFDMEYCANFLKIFSGKEEAAFRQGLKARLAELFIKMREETNLKVKAKFNYFINYVNNYYIENYNIVLFNVVSNDNK